MSRTQLWDGLEPLLPQRTRRYHHPGWLRRDDRAALAGFLHVLRTGVNWQQLPTTAFGVSGFGLGGLRWLVEDSFARLHAVKRCASATNAAQTSTRHSSRWRAR